METRPAAIALDYSRSVSDRRYKWWVVVMLWFICFLNYGDRQAIFALFPVLRKVFGFGPPQLGLIGAAFMWSYAFGGPIAGFIGDRFRRKDIILGGCIFWSFITITTAWCSKLWQFVVVRTLEGFGETFYFPSSMSLISDYHGPRTRSKAMAFHQSSVYIGTIAGSWLAAVLAVRFGWRIGFYVFGFAGIVLALLLYAFLREPLRGQSEGKQKTSSAAPLSLKEPASAIFRTPTAALLMGAFVCANFVATTFLTWTPTFLTDKFHFGLASAGLSGTAFIHLSSAISAPLGGVMADRLRRRFTGGRMLVQATGLLAGSIFVVLVGTTRRVETLLAAMALFGFCKGLYDSNIFASLFDTIEPRARSTAAGVMNTVGWGGGALGPLIFGYVAGNGPPNEQVQNMSRAIAVNGIIYVAGAVLLLWAAFGLARQDRLKSAARKREPEPDTTT